MIAKQSECTNNFPDNKLRELNCVFSGSVLGDTMLHDSVLVDAMLNDNVLNTLRLNDFTKAHLR